MIEIKDLLTLSDDKDYIVVSKVNYENNTYYYLKQINENEVKFLYEEDDSLIEVEDKDLIKTLSPLFFEEVKEFLPKANEN